MAAWLDILADPRLTAGGRFNPFALGKNFTQGGRTELDALNTANLREQQLRGATAQRGVDVLDAVPVTDDPTVTGAKQQAFRVAQELAKYGLLDQGKPGQFDATTAQTGLDTQQLNNRIGEQNLYETSTTFNQSQKDARDRAIAGRPMSVSGVQADQGYRQLGQADRSFDESKRQFGVQADSAKAAADQRAAQFRAEQELETRRLDDSKSKGLMQYQSELMQLLGQVYRPEDRALVAGQLDKQGIRAPATPEDPRKAALMSVLQGRSQPVAAQPPQQPQPQPNLPGYAKADFLRQREQQPTQKPQIKLGRGEAGAQVQQAHKQQQLNAAQTQLNELQRMSTYDQSVYPNFAAEIQRLRDFVAQAMKGVK